MFKLLSKKIHPFVYVKINENRIDIREMSTKQRVLSSTLEKPITAVELISGGFANAEKSLRKVLNQLKTSLILAYRPIVVIHPIGSLQKELSAVEQRAFLELALGAGSYKAVVWTGHELSDDEVIEKAKTA